MAMRALYSPSLMPAPLVPPIEVPPIKVPPKVMTPKIVPPGGVAAVPTASLAKTAWLPATGPAAAVAQTAQISSRSITKPGNSAAASSWEAAAKALTRTAWLEGSALHTSTVRRRGSSSQPSRAPLLMYDANFCRNTSG